MIAKKPEKKQEVKIFFTVCFKCFCFLQPPAPQQKPSKPKPTGGLSLFDDDNDDDDDIFGFSPPSKTGCVKCHLCLLTLLFLSPFNQSREIIEAKERTRRRKTRRRGSTVPASLTACLVALMRRKEMICSALHLPRSTRNSQLRSVFTNTAHTGCTHIMYTRVLMLCV